MARALITVRKTAKRGEIIEIRALVQHPRDLIRTFACRFIEAGKADDAGSLVFAATLHAAIAANPYLSFHLRAASNGTLVFTWAGDNGFRHREQVALTVA
mgnify:CR=1 FL=1